ncbi:Por secretion system C-terminal sorting domain-containing protein [Lishizhenia tianjinensis]|uniref:Por secretion system C-terminal sorting domain-containing protein n=1 Tax=Lishizhenia tianjinensis TaxID=477690 RepID=A0A1I7B5N0_9FLAO|nr:GEVED domain-containing protein [Lishizhenia tianjinensis]SFT82461.1 Por secretion system C-terminal sorting domain-containing protein [Lishizhenia tianjinensis]
MKKLYFLCLMLAISITSAFSQTYSIPHAQIHNAINVDTVQLNNASNNFINVQQVCGFTSSYGNFNNLTAQLQANSTYSLDVGVNTCSSTFYTSVLEAWIDYNRNGIFEQNESILLDNVSSQGTANYTFTVPATALNGWTKMRVMLEKDTTAPLDANNDISVGNILDMSLLINGGLCSPPSNLEVTGITPTSMDLSFTPGQAINFIIEYGPYGFQQGTGTTMNIATTNATLTNLLPNTVYDVCVRSLCAPGDTSTSTCTTAATSGLPLYVNNVIGQCPSFQDITFWGTNLNLTNGQASGLTLPFSFEFQGQVINEVTVGHDGALILGTQTGTIGTDIASSTQNGFFVFNQALSAYTNGVLTDGVYYLTDGFAPNRKFIVQWKNRGYVSSSQNNADRINFEIVLEENTGNCYFIYEDVVFSNPNFDFGKDAEIGVRGPLQNLDISLNDATYLQGNSCVVLEPTICDPIFNLTRQDLSENVIRYTWANTNSSVSIEYGPTGYTPGAGINLNVSGSNQHQFVLGTNGLAAGNTYEVYFNTNCGNASQGPALMDTFTFVDCTPPKIIDADVHTDTLIIALDNSNTNFNYQNHVYYKYVGSPAYTHYVQSNLSWPVITIDSIVDLNLNTPFMLEVCAMRECYSQGQYIDSSAWSCYPTPVPANISTNTSPSSSIPLSVNGVALVTTNQNVSNASISTQLASAIPTGNTLTGWGNQSVNNALWFHFTAPASGNVIIDATGINHLNKSISQPINVANKAAVFSTTDVNNANAFSFIEANDNSMFDTSLVSFDWVLCGLTPGDTYFILYSDDDVTAAGGEFSIRLTDPETLQDIQFEANPGICYTGESMDLTTTLSTYPNEEGFWFSTVPFVNASILNHHLMVQDLQEGFYDISYASNLGCASDTVSTQIELDKLPYAGEPSSQYTMVNCPVDLLIPFPAGDIPTDTGGYWIDPNYNIVPNPDSLVAQVPGQYNYRYVVEGSVCPNDTALLVLLVDPSGNCHASAEEASQISKIEIYPNPSKGIFSILVNSSANKIAYKIYDTKGSSLQGDFIEIPTNETVVIDVQELRPSIYFMEIKQREYTTILKLVIQ